MAQQQKIKTKHVVKSKQTCCACTQSKLGQVISWRLHYL